MSQKDKWLLAVCNTAKYASDAILDYYQGRNFQILNKSDDSPVTDADLASDRIIREQLQLLDTKLPIISEETIPAKLLSAHFPNSSTSTCYWLVDPLDGTREFIKGSPDFSVNIALINNERPVLGVVYVPAKDEIYWAEQGQGAYVQSQTAAPERLQVPAHFHSPLRVAVSHSLKTFDAEAREHWLSRLKSLGPYELNYIGSALKICLVAKGEMDLYPRFGPTGIWDTAAGQCILEEAGGRIVDNLGRPLKYQAEISFINPPFFAFGCVDLLTYIVDNLVK